MAAAGRRLLAGAAACAALVVGAVPAAAQGGETVDYVVAVVGNSPILNSQLQEEMFSRQPQGTPLPTDSALLAPIRAKVLSDLIDQEVVLQLAQRDTSIKVTDQDVADAVESRYREVRQNFTSEVDFRRELKNAGFGTPEEYRRWLTDGQRRHLYQTKYFDLARQKDLLKPVTPTEAELRAYFDAATDKGQRPAAIAFRQLVVAPRPSAAERETARL
ncbi:MAG TPA: SurA N-terminal domain-containing protein, partial [Gemmatimonadales bacterium]|nr:SurA N-terminal domain-containing protein [Gemmatimonadales bacterium]